MTQTRGVLAQDNLFDFFHAHVDAAARARRGTVSGEAALYLTQLLVEQTRPCDRDADAERVTLAELRARAVAAPASSSLPLWRRLGDTALFLAGYFREEIVRRRVTPAYAETLGASAYGTVGVLAGGGGAASVFSELAERFHACTEILADVRDDVGAGADADVVRIYEEWLRTGSPRAAARLQGMGVIPVRSLPS